MAKCIRFALKRRVPLWLLKMKYHHPQYKSPALLADASLKRKKKFLHSSQTTLRPPRKLKAEMVAEPTRETTDGPYGRRGMVRSSRRLLTAARAHLTTPMLRLWQARSIPSEAAPFRASCECQPIWASPIPLRPQ